MKTKAKLTLAISALSAVVLAAGITSSYAWLTTQSTATFNSGSLTVDTISEIKVAKKEVDYYAQETSFSDAATSVTGTNRNLGVVSTNDGIDFYAPTALKATNSYVVGDVAKVTNSTAWTNSNKYVGYARYVIQVTAKTETNGRDLKVWFTPTVEGTQLTSSYRVAFYESNADGSLATSPSPALTILSNAAETYTPLVASATSKTTVAISNYDGTVTEQTTKKLSLVSNWTAPGTQETPSPAVGDTQTKYYVVAFWVEGTDADATNNVGGQKLSVAVTFGLEAHS